MAEPDRRPDEPLGGPLRIDLAAALTVEDEALHEVVRDGDRVAARYTLRALMRRGRVAASEIFMFGALDPDGRLRRVEQLTRILSDPDGA